MRKLRGFPYHAGLFPTGQHKLLPNTCCCACAVLMKGHASWAATIILKVLLCLFSKTWALPNLSLRRLRRLAMRRRPPFSNRPFQLCLRAAIYVALRKPERARPPHLRCRHCTISPRSQRRVSNIAAGCLSCRQRANLRHKSPTASAHMASFWA